MPPRQGPVVSRVSAGFCRRMAWDRVRCGGQFPGWVRSLGAVVRTWGLSCVRLWRTVLGLVVRGVCFVTVSTWETVIT